jgi:hypothetical protein
LSLIGKRREKEREKEKREKQKRKEEERKRREEEEELLGEYGVAQQEPPEQNQRVPELDQSEEQVVVEPIFLAAKTTLQIIMRWGTKFELTKFEIVYEPNLS